ISTLSGLWGVLVTDLFQFVIKMGMVIVLAVVAVHAVGGIEAMKAKLALIDQARAASGSGGSVLSFVPDVGSAWMPMLTFFVYIAVNWWATWYPGAEPGGGGYVAQRMLSAKDERHSLLATLWFNIAHYAVRPWPWILVALASLILFPGLPDPETGYIRVMIDYLPSSLRGLMVAAFAAAFMSTIATQLNWGASYLVNDFYRRFVRRDASEPHYVLASRVATALLTVISAAVAFRIESIGGAWKLLIITGAGTGAVLLLRWYWWRINAWSEVLSPRGRRTYRPPATDSPTCSTGWPDACWCTACCSAWVSCCCTRPARACCCSRSARSPGGSSTATCRVAGGAPWWSDGRLELRVR